MGKLGWFLGGIATGVAGVAAAAYIFDEVSHGSSHSYSSEDTLASSTEVEDIAEDGITDTVNSILSEENRNDEVIVDKLAESANMVEECIETNKEATVTA